MFDLPVLAAGIPKTLSLDVAGHAANKLTVSLQHIALVHALALSEKGSNVITNADSMYSRTLEHAMDGIDNAVSANHQLRCSIEAWPDESAALVSTNRPAAMHTECSDEFFQRNLEENTRAGVLLQFNEMSLAISTTPKTTLDQLEACLPGYCKLLYQVLEVVNHTCLPVYTPRTVVEHALSEFYHYSEHLEETLCDVSFARHILNNFHDEDEFLDKYKADESNPVEFLSAFNEECPQLLPSAIFEAFGQSVNDTLLWERRNTPPLKSQIHESLASLQVQAELRSWCPQRKHLVATLEMMQTIFQLTNNGARFSCHGDWLSNPSSMARQIVMDSHEVMFSRMLDDATEPAQQCGDVLDCSGYFALYADSSESAIQGLQTLNQGAHVVVTTLRLLNTIGYS